MTPRRLVLVTSRDCHLCAHARTVLTELGRDRPLIVRELDVEDPGALELAAAGVPLSFLPVLVEGERVVGYGRLSERRLRKELAS